MNNLWQILFRSEGTTLHGQLVDTLVVHELVGDGFAAGTFCTVLPIIAFIFSIFLIELRGRLSIPGCLRLGHCKTLILLLQRQLLFFQCDPSISSF